jgi:hypothetical protein
LGLSVILSSSLEKQGIDDPNEEQIVRQIERVMIFSERSGEEFVVLAEGRYGLLGKYGPSLIQLASNRKGWIVEYRDGETETLYRARSSMDRQHIQEMFLQFARHDATYRSSVAWERRD